MPKHPKNVLAVFEWYEKHMPQDADTIRQLFNQNHESVFSASMQAILLQGFEAGREFERDHPEVQSGIGYLE